MFFDQAEEKYFAAEKVIHREIGFAEEAEWKEISL